MKLLEVLNTGVYASKVEICAFDEQRTDKLGGKHNFYKSVLIVGRKDKDAIEKLKPYYEWEVKKFEVQNWTLKLLVKKEKE